MAGTLNIKQWDEEDRPREKLMAKGAEALSDAELLAILIGSGSTEESAVDLMRRVMKDCDNSLKQLGRMSIDDLTQAKYKGLGPAKAVTIMAACELGRRRMMETAEEKVYMRDCQDLYAYFLPRMQDLDHEQCHVLLLRQDLSVIKNAVVSVGGIASASVDVRRVMYEAVVNHAPVIAVAHNHPSGNHTPSRHDDDLTRRIADACRMMQIRLLDHIVVTDRDYYSYVMEGKL